MSESRIELPGAANPRFWFELLDKSDGPPSPIPCKFELLPSKPLGWLYEYCGLAAAKAKQENTINALMIIALATGIPCVCCK